MFMQTLRFLVLACVVHNSMAAEPSNQEPKVCSLDYQFDYFVLSLNWPRGVCYRYPCALKLSQKQTWNIHGLWQNKRRPADGDSGFCCGPRFNRSHLNDQLLAEMKQKWQTLLFKRNDNVFWSHEFNKHGTCATKQTQIKNAESYFRTGLSLYDRLNLNSLGFKKGQEIAIDELHRRIESKVGKKVSVKCLPVPVSKLDVKPSWARNDSTIVPAVWEVNICYDKSLSPTQSQAIDCPKRDVNCRGSITFP